MSKSGNAGRVLLAAPRGYCAGVERAVTIVEGAVAVYGAPVYVRRHIVHNVHVVERLQQLGAVFVEETTQVPTGAVLIFSAHGVAPREYEQAALRQLRVIDATCPLVSKVHREASRQTRPLTKGRGQSRHLTDSLVALPGRAFRSTG